MVIEEQEFAESKGESSGNRQRSQEYPTDNDGFMNIPDGIDEELPFN